MAIMILRGGSEALLQPTESEVWMNSISHKIIEEKLWMVQIRLSILTSREWEWEELVGRWSWVLPKLFEYNTMSYFDSHFPAVLVGLHTCIRARSDCCSNYSRTDWYHPSVTQKIPWYFWNGILSCRLEAADINWLAESSCVDLYSNVLSTDWLFLKCDHEKRGWNNTCNLLPSWSFIA